MLFRSLLISNFPDFFLLVLLQYLFSQKIYSKWIQFYLKNWGIFFWSRYSLFWWIFHVHFCIWVECSINFSKIKLAASVVQVFLYIFSYYLREGNGNPLQYYCLENPRDRGGGLPSMDSHRVRHDWSDLAAAAEIICLLVWSMIERILKYSTIILDLSSSLYNSIR